jgi:ATP-dependent DNA helicase RecG
MEVEELKELLKGREKRTLEYKRAWNEVPKNMFDTVCAFLNRDGGVIVLGVEDNGQIKKGVDPEAVHQMCKDISNLSNNPQKLSPTFLLQPEEVDVDGKKVIVVFVPSSSQVHKSAGSIYDRSTDGDYILKTDAEISVLYLRKRQAYSENHVFPYLRLEHLDENTIAKARQLIRRKFPNHPWLEMETMEMMRQANLYCYDLETNKSGFNLAALMLFGKQEFIQSALPYYRLDAVVRLDNVDRYDDRLPLMGNIIDSYDALMAFVEKHLPDPFFLEGDQRTSLREKIFREMVADMKKGVKLD